MNPLSSKICNVGIICSNIASTCANSQGSLLCSTWAEPGPRAKHGHHHHHQGWHLGLNHCATGKLQLPLYLLINLFHHEACQIRLISERKLRRIQQKKFWYLKTKFFALWDAFNSKDCSARKFLKACSHLNSPAAS